MSKVELHLVSREIDKPNGDVIFIHGLGGDHVTTWTSKNEVGKRARIREFHTYFPEVISADFALTNFWSLSYTANILDWWGRSNHMGFGQVCSQILNCIINKGIGTRPIIFICHSLGGIVAKEVLKKSEFTDNPRLKLVFQNTTAVSFIATPHQGSSWANVFDNINVVLPFFQGSDVLQRLKLDSDYLEGLGDWYRAKSVEAKIDTQAFRELRKTSGIMIVPKYSANPYVINGQVIEVNKNHIDIAKPARKNSAVYLNVASLIKYHLYDRERFENPTVGNAIPPQTVVIGIVFKGQKVLMVRRRNPIDKLTWQFVAGRLKVGQESADECIVREVVEEANVQANVLRKLGVKEDESTAFRRIYYSLEYVDGDILNGDPDENDELRWVRISNVRSMITTPLSPAIEFALDQHQNQMTLNR